jgi:hypothetical protein
VAFYPKLGLVCYGSEAAATKAPLAVVPASPSDLAMAAALAQGADIEEVFFVRVSLRPASCRCCRKPKVWAHCRLLIRTRQQTFFTVLRVASFACWTLGVITLGAPHELRRAGCSARPGRLRRRNLLARLGQLLPGDGRPERGIRPAHGASSPRKEDLKREPI